MCFLLKITSYKNTVMLIIYDSLEFSENRTQSNFSENRLWWLIVNQQSSVRVIAESIRSERFEIFETSSSVWSIRSGSIPSVRRRSSMRSRSKLSIDSVISLSPNSGTYGGGVGGGPFKAVCTKWSYDSVLGDFTDFKERTRTRGLLKDTKTGWKPWKSFESDVEYLSCDFYPKQGLEIYSVCARLLRF